MALYWLLKANFFLGMKQSLLGKIIQAITEAMTF